MFDMKFILDTAAKQFGTTILGAYAMRRMVIRAQGAERISYDEIFKWFTYIDQLCDI